MKEGGGRVELEVRLRVGGGGSRGCDLAGDGGQSAPRRHGRRRHRGGGGGGGGTRLPFICSGQSRAGSLFVQKLIILNLVAESGKNFCYYIL